MDAIVADLVYQFDDDQRDYFDERAGIREFDAGFPRAHAECLALLEVLSEYPTLITGISTMQIERNGATEWLVTTDIDYARQQLAKIGAVEISVLDLADVIDEHFRGIALLTNEPLRREV